MIRIGGKGRGKKDKKEEIQRNGGKERGKEEGR